jgi:hypothetical protein
MHQLTKAQIYSINEYLPANQVALMWDVLDRLKRTHREENSEVADNKSKLQENYKDFVELVFTNFFRPRKAAIYILNRRTANRKHEVKET